MSVQTRRSAGTAWAAGDDCLVCQSVRDETRDVKSFRFAAESGARFVFHPGQYLTLAVPLETGPAWRSFTIASSALRDESVDLTIKAQADGNATRWLHDHLRPGMGLAGRKPGGSFRLESIPERPLVLVSAGSGATPMAAILRWLADHGAPTRVHHVHVGRTPEDLLFRRELSTLAERTGRWTLDWMVTRGVAQDGIRAGRPDAGLFGKLIPTLGEAEVFACGPGAFMAAVEAAHRAAGGAPERFHQEGFGGEGSMVVPPQPTTQEQVVRFLPSGKETRTRPGESILEAGLRLGVRIPNSCRQGICGSCLVQKETGEVAMNHEGGISDEEVADGAILACCSYPRSPVTVKVS
ncbi:MAG: iron-sulfur cluster-binding domain-containing protein [Methylorubrum populi]